MVMIASRPYLFPLTSSIQKTFFKTLYRLNCSTWQMHCTMSTQQTLGDEEQHIQV